MTENILGVVQIEVDDPIRVAMGDCPQTVRTVVITTEHMGVRRKHTINLYGRRVQDLELLALTEN